MKLKHWIVPIMLIVLFAVGMVGLTVDYDNKIKNLEREVNYTEIVVESHLKEHHPDTSFFLDSPKEGLMDALLYYEIPHPDIVYAQAILETGWFTSCSHNNLFGLSPGGKHKKYNHWKESVQAYKKYISSKYDGNEDYFVFLERIKYAEDPKYTFKLKQILKKL